MATSEALAPVVPHPAALDRSANLATAEVIARTRQIREVMEKVMKENVHFGVIPGTQKPTMYQPGADVLAVTFRIAPKVDQIDDLSTDDSVRYRVRVQGVHQVTSELLAEGVGECSSDEEKYRWRRPVVDDEWKETSEDRRREKWARGKNGGYKQKQIRTSPADVANTVLKMAVKRAKIAMILNATAASDVFAQDLEDLSEELRESLAGDETPAPQTVQQPQRRSETSSSQPAPPQPPAAGGTTKPAAAAEPPVGVLVRNLERRVSPSGVHFWIVTGDTKTDDYYLLPETGEAWPALLDVLRKLETERRRAEFDVEQPQGQKFPSIVGITPIGATS